MNKNGIVLWKHQNHLMENDSGGDSCSVSYRFSLILASWGFGPGQGLLGDTSSLKQVVRKTSLGKTCGQISREAGVIRLGQCLVGPLAARATGSLLNQWVQLPLHSACPDAIESALPDPGFIWFVDGISDQICQGACLPALFSAPSWVNHWIV